MKTIHLAKETTMKQTSAQLLYILKFLRYHSPKNDLSWKSKKQTLDGRWNQKDEHS